MKAIIISNLMSGWRVCGLAIPHMMTVWENGLKCEKLDSIQPDSVSLSSAWLYSAKYILWNDSILQMWQYTIPWLCVNLFETWLNGWYSDIIQWNDSFSSNQYSNIERRVYSQ